MCYAVVIGGMKEMSTPLHKLPVVAARWARTNETPEEIAQMTTKFINELSPEIDISEWGKPNGIRKVDANSIANYIKETDRLDDMSSPELDGYRLTLGVYDTPSTTDLLTNLNINAGAAEIPRLIPSPSAMQTFYNSEWNGIKKLGMCSMTAMITAFDPVVVSFHDAELNLCDPRRDSWAVPLGYYVWINDSIGHVDSFTPGLQVTRLKNGTLITVPDKWPAEKVAESLLETYSQNNIRDIPR
jgi:hypothetical protein